MNAPLNHAALAVHSAERDYANAITAVPGVLQHDADMDSLLLAGIADRCVELARYAWKNKPTSDTGYCGEYVLVQEARALGDVIAGGLGLSREAAVLLDRQIERAAQ